MPRDHDAYVLASPDDYFFRDDDPEPEEKDVPAYLLTFGETDGKCSECKTRTQLVSTSHWQTHPEGDEDDTFVEPNGETSGHYCPTCNCLTAVFVHPRP